MEEEGETPQPILTAFVVNNDMGVEEREARHSLHRVVECRAFETFFYESVDEAFLLCVDERNGMFA